jgi:hypothetical protein
MFQDNLVVVVELLGDLFMLFQELFLFELLAVRELHVSFVVELVLLLDNFALLHRGLRLLLDQFLHIFL